MNGDFWPYGTFYYNVTGLTSYFNFLDPVYPSNPYQNYLNLNTTQAAIHVNSVVYEHYNKTVETYLIGDWMKSVANVLPTLLNNYKVMIYNGQNDVILGPPPAENFIRTIPWNGQLNYLATPKIIWRVNPTDAEVFLLILLFSQFLFRKTNYPFFLSLLVMSDKLVPSFKLLFVMLVIWFLLINLQLHTI